MNISSCLPTPGGLPPSVMCFPGTCGGINDTCACPPGWTADSVMWKTAPGSNCWLPTSVTAILDGFMGFFNLSLLFAGLYTISKQGSSFSVAILTVGFGTSACFCLAHYVNNQGEIGVWAILFLTISIICYAYVITTSIYRLLAQFWKASQSSTLKLRRRIYFIQHLSALTYAILCVIMMLNTGTASAFNLCFSLWLVNTMAHLSVLSWLILVPTRPIEAAILKMPIMQQASSESRLQSSTSLDANTSSTNLTDQVKRVRSLLRKIRLFRFGTAIICLPVLAIGVSCLTMQFITGYLPFTWVITYVFLLNMTLFGMIQLVLNRKYKANVSIKASDHPMSLTIANGTVFANEDYVAQAKNDVVYDESQVILQSFNDTALAQVLGPDVARSWNKASARYFSSSAGTVTLALIFTLTCALNAAIMIGAIPAAVSVFNLVGFLFVLWTVALTLSKRILIRLFWTQFWLLRLFVTLSSAVLGGLVLGDVRAMMLLPMSTAIMMCFSFDAMFIKTQLRIAWVLAGTVFCLGTYVMIQLNLIVNVTNLIVVVPGFATDFSLYQLFRDNLLAQTIFLGFEALFILRGRKRFRHITQGVARDLVLLKQQAHVSLPRLRHNEHLITGLTSRLRDSMQRVRMESGFLVKAMTVHHEAPEDDEPAANKNQVRIVQHVSLHQSEAIVFSLLPEPKACMWFARLEAWLGPSLWALASSIGFGVLVALLALPDMNPNWALWCLLAIPLHVASETLLRSETLLLMLVKRTEFILQALFGAIFLVAMSLSFPDARACLVLYFTACYLSQLLVDADLGDRASSPLLALKMVLAPAVLGCMLIAFSLCILIGVTTTSVEQWVDFRPGFVEANVSFLDSASVWDIHQTSADLGVSIGVNCLLMAVWAFRATTRGRMVFVRAPMAPKRDGLTTADDHHEAHNLSKLVTGASSGANMVEFPVPVHLRQSLQHSTAPPSFMGSRMDDGVEN